MLDSVPVPPLPSRIRAIVAGYPELIAVIVAAIVGLTVQRPLAWLAGHRGRDIRRRAQDLVRVDHGLPRGRGHF